MVLCLWFLLPCCARLRNVRAKESMGSFILRSKFFFSPLFFSFSQESSLPFYFELGFHLPVSVADKLGSLQVSRLCVRSAAHIYICVGVCMRKERRRSGGLWRNEGVQGQSEGTDFSSASLADDGLIRRGGGSFAAEVEKEVLINL